MNRTATPARRLAIAGASAMLALGLTACSDDEPTEEEQRSRHALEQVVKANETALDAQMESLKTLYSDVSVTAEGDNTLAITYVFANEMPAESLESLRGDDNPMNEQVRSTVLPQLEQAGVTDPQIRLTVENPDGTEVFSNTITSAE